MPTAAARLAGFAEKFIEDYVRNDYRVAEPYGAKVQEAVLRFLDRKGTAQYNRDLMKDSVLAKAGLPLLRLSTEGSDEKERIVSCLEKLV